MKFTYRNDLNNDLHWQFCEKNHAPFIELSVVNDVYTNIFYDITNYQVSLEAISDDIKELYASYLRFFMISDPILQESYDQIYFFNLIVKRDHAEFLAEQLFDYLVFKLDYFRGN